MLFSLISTAVRGIENIWIKAWIYKKREFPFHWRERTHLTNGVICFHPDLLKHQALIMHSIPLMANAVVAILSLKLLKNQWATKLINCHGNWTNKGLFEIYICNFATVCNILWTFLCYGKDFDGQHLPFYACCVAILQDLTIHTSIIIGGGMIFSFSSCN